METWNASQLLESGKLHHARRISGLATGICDLDAMTGGLPKGLVLLAGRPSSGERALAERISLNLAATGTPVVWFSTQYSAAALVGRLLGHSMSEQILLNSSALSIVDSPTLTIEMIRAHRTVASEVGRKAIGPSYAVVVDHLEMLLKCEATGTLNQSEMAKGLRFMAMERNISFVICCGLSRNLEDRKNKWPKLSDLDDVSPFALEADLILATHYSWIYDGATGSKDDWDICVLKNRNGCTGGISTHMSELPWPSYVASVPPDDQPRAAILSSQTGCLQT